MEKKVKSIHCSLADLDYSDDALRDNVVVLDDAVNQKNLQDFMKLAERLGSLNCKLSFKTEYNQQMFSEFAKISNKELVKVTLLDDNEFKTWNLKQLSEFAGVRIPMSKVMWMGDKLPQGVTTNVGPQVENEHIQKIKQIIQQSFGNFDNMTDVEKVVAVDSFLQKNIQYIGSSETSINGIKYRAAEGQPAHHSMVIDALETNRGVCDNYSYLMTLLLNNPTAKVQCCDVCSNGHTWNNIVIDGRTYPHDITQNVTAGRHRLKDSLQASAYNYGATLSTPADLDIGGRISLHREGKSSPPLNWWKGARALHSGEATLNDRGTVENYQSLTARYPLADKRVAPDKIETAIESLKQKGFGHLFEFPKQPYYKQIAEPFVEDTLSR